MKISDYTRAQRKVPGMLKCWGKSCPNGSVTSYYNEDTQVIDGKAYCSACGPTDHFDADMRRRAARAEQERLKHPTRKI